MTIRTCQNCGKTFDRKSVYDNHINPNRKFPCIAPKFDIAPILHKFPLNLLRNW